MRIRLANRLKIQQKLTISKVVVTTCVAIVITGLSVVVMHLKHPERAMAADCESTYTLNWSIPSTYTVTCGSVNASNWTVKGYTCYYYSPIFNVGGNVGDPDKMADISVRINQSGNLDGNDTAWVFMYADGNLVETYSKLGDISAAVFSVDLNMVVHAGGTYQIVIKLMNDKTNETWQIKNGDVTSCLRSFVPLPVELAGFNAKTDPSGIIKLSWITQSETNNDFFTVEHSTSGVSFKELKRIKGAGNSTSTKNYYFTDEKPVEGINYYRLMQTDYDGTNNYSSVVKASVSVSGSRQQNIRVYPNPFTENFAIDFNAEADQEILVQLVSMDGKIVVSGKYSVDKGLNSLPFMPVLPVRSGNYLVHIFHNETLIGSSKVICKK